MIYFISDTHFGHANSITLNNRPFKDVDEMDERMISNWNGKVKPKDAVYILGDLVHKSAEPEKYLKLLNGKKILVAGNHDVKWLKKLGMAKDTETGGVEFFGYGEYFENITQYLEIRIDGRMLTMCHYPMLEWRASRKFGSRKLGFLLHGHIHNNTGERYKPMFMLPHAINVSADVNGYTPVTFDEAVKNNEEFKLCALENPVDRARLLSEKYHMYQCDKSGKPYLLHPAFVASQLKTRDEKCVGYLHDIIEDTDIDIALLERHFSKRVVNAVKAMTHAQGEDYFDYIARVKTNKIARNVKLADLAHNMDMSRFSAVTERDLSRLEKYKKARAILTEE